MSNVIESQGEALFQQIIRATNELERCLNEQNWQDAVNVERDRYAMLQKLSTIGSVTKSDRYTTFLRQALEFIRARQPEIEAELQRSHRNLSELGQQRVATGKYRDVLAT